ncbi:MAG: hypothetical protein HY360_07520 [Verrucomicrobia bacterium]|nr:hypothetical protein [Verrucomicrobiota bacterium]
MKIKTGIFALRDRVFFRFPPSKRSVAQFGLPLEWARVFQSQLAAAIQQAEVYRSTQSSPSNKEPE